MESKKVTELKSIAKELGLSRYSKLRKHELIQMIRRFMDNQRDSSNILDETVPEINITILKPTQFSARGKVELLKSQAGRISELIIGKKTNYQTS